MQHRKTPKTPNKYPKFIIFIILLISVFSVATVAVVVADNFTITPITVVTFNFDTEMPAIWEDRIVWQDRIDYNYEIILYNSTSGEEIRLTTGGSDEIHPDIFGDFVVWEEWSDENYNIILYDLNSHEEVPITDEIQDQVNPTIWGPIIAWEDQRGDQKAIFYYDLNTSEVVEASEPGFTSKKPDVWGNFIVWEQLFGDNSEIMLYNISNHTRQRITFDAENQEYPSIWEDRIVWMEYRDGYRQLSLYNITTGIRTNLTSDPWYHRIPVIFGDTIAYEYKKEEKDKPDISLLNITTGNEVLLSPETPDSAQDQPAIWDKRIVWKDDRSHAYDIYLCTFGISLSPLTADFISNITEGMAPLDVKFTDSSIGNIYGWWWDFGDGTESREQNPVHTYVDPEIYSVILTINNPWQRSAVEREGVITAGTAPRPDFTADVYSGPAPLSVQFWDGSVGYPEKWLWDFGDGDTDNNQNPFHEYNSAGTYTVKLTAENKWGNGTVEKESCITVMDADTHEVILPVDGVNLEGPDGIYLILNCSPFNATEFDPLVNQSIITCIPYPYSGIAALQFLTDDPGGFSLTGNDTIEGNLSGIEVLSLDFQSENRNSTEGLVWNYNYSAFLPHYPQNGKITSLLWEGSTPEDQILFEIIAIDNQHHVKNTAYTILFQQENIWSSGPATLTFGIDSDWIEEYGWRPCIQIEGNVEQCMIYIDGTYIGNTPLCLSERLSPGNHTMTVYKYGFESNNSTITFEDKRDYIRVIRMSDWGEGSLLDTRFLYHDNASGMDYFQAYSPEGFSKFGIVSVWQEGNIFQLIQLITAKVVGPSSGSSGGGGGGGGHSGSSGSSWVSENAPAQGTTRVPTPSPPSEGSFTESQGDANTGITVSPGVTMEPGEPAPPQTNGEDQQGPPSNPLPIGTLTFSILKNLSIVFVVIFVTVVFYLRWKKKEE